MNTTSRSTRVSLALLCIGILPMLTACGNLINIKQVGSAAIVQEPDGEVSLAVQTCGSSVLSIQSSDLNAAEESQSLDEVIFEEPKSGRFNVTLPQLRDALNSAQSRDVYLLIDVRVKRSWKDSLPFTADPYIPPVQLHSADFGSFAPGTLVKSSVNPDSTDYLGGATTEQELRKACQK